MKASTLVYVIVDEVNGVNCGKFFAGYQFRSTLKGTGSFIAEFDKNKVWLFHNVIDATETFNELKETFPDVEIKEVCFK